ncbi:hypothetical protein SEA_BEUFFERT_248 [Streptomyces phage Beuffert]|nr:hypothetical protein SEA_BEUFFERT_248 [Streptomyces phage Beuffert]
MLIMQAEELHKGQRIYQVFNLNSNFREVHFLAGPFKNDNQPVYHIVCRDENGHVRLYNLNEVTLYPPVPEEGEVWENKTTQTQYEVKEVGKKYIVLAYTPSAGHDSPHAISVEKFTKNYRKVANDTF